MRHTKKTTLQIIRITGSDETGKDRHSYLNLAHVNPEIADDDLLSIGKKLSNLQSFPVDGIGRVDSCLLAQEG